MKKSILFLFLVFNAGMLLAQPDTARIEQYCTVIANPRLLSSRVTIEIDYGEQRSIWKDNRLKNEDGRAIKFNTVVDALNFMGRNGWQLVNAFPFSSGNNTFTYHYVFRKQFLKSEAAEQ